MADEIKKLAKDLALKAAIMALEWGFNACENGKNLDTAKAEFMKIWND